jgi:hypothetical protein
MPETTVQEPKPAEPAPPQLTEQQITEQYLEKRKKGETADLPVPPPTIPEVTEQPPEVTVPEPQTVEAYLAEREQRERKKRGGKQARIDELTKEKAELEAKNAELAKKAEEAAKIEPPKPAPTTEVPPQATKEVPTAPVVAPKAAPKIADYSDIDKYQTDLALWAAEQTKTSVQGNVQAPAAAPTPVPAPAPVDSLRKEEFDRFLEEGKRFIQAHPDFNTRLEAAQIRGLTISDKARFEITKKAGAGLQAAYWLTDPQNDLAARTFMQLNADDQLVEIGRIIERVSAKPSDFISNAPEPGTRLSTSNVRQDVPLNEITDTDEYIRQRRQQRRTARGR